MRVHYNGAALPATLLLITATSLTALAAMQSARTETRLGGTVRATHIAFALAELGIANGFAYAQRNPAGLPDAAPLTLPEQDVEGMGRVTVTLLPGPTDTVCPALAPSPTTRRHFEIRATAITGNVARTTHVQGFYVCREICSEPDCIATESLPVRSYWQQRLGAAP